MDKSKRKIFLASSAELVEDRREFEIFINRQNKRWHERGVFLELVIWEDFVDAMSQTRLQDEYNKALKGCDVFVMLFWTKVGMYTAEEFETAFGQFKATGRPLIYTYFKNAPILTGVANRRDMTSLWDFQDKLKTLGHFQTEYDSVAALTGHFGEQLEKLALSGAFGTGLKPESGASLAAAAPTNTATLHGNGAIAQGANAQAVGAGGILIGGNNSGVVNAGTIQTGGGAFFGGPVTARNIVGRDHIVHAPAASASIGSDLQTVLAALASQIRAHAPEGQSTSAEQAIDALGSEVIKGRQADDSKLAHLVKGLIDLVPAAVGGIVSAFASPVLGGLAGPLTKAVLDRFGSN